MARKLLIVVGVLVALVVLLIVAQPSNFAIQREAYMAAPPATVYALVDDFHGWAQWSPWDKLDPAMKKTYSGAAKGVGAVYAWQGNDDVGTGKMTITEAVAEKSVGIDLEFQEPFASTNRTELSLAPEGEGTRVTWRMTGKNDFAGKAMNVVMNMDQLIGRDFEAGLANLRGASEQAVRDAKEAAAAAPEEQAVDAGSP